MEIKSETKTDSLGVRFSARADGVEAGRVWLYVLKNDLHPEAFGYLEDLFVEDNFRHQGIGTKLVAAAVAEAKSRGCYKLIFTTRHSKTETKAWYEQLGFKDWGTEFRMDLK